MPFIATPISFGSDAQVDQGEVAEPDIDPVTGMAATISFDVPLPPLETVIDIRLGVEDAATVVSMAPVTSVLRRDLVNETWGWEEVRDYVVHKIQDRWGAFPRDPVKEASIFRSFFGRWGDLARPIAEAACEAHGCIWRSAPLAVSRFTKGNDPFFAKVIADNLVAA